MLWACVQAGELVYHCSDCAADSTCVFCAKCFKASDHTGHNFNTQSGGGGICDCGDPEAWDPNHFCERHKARPSSSASGGGADESDPLTGVPPHIINATTSVVQAVLEDLASYLHAIHASFLDPQRGTMPFQPSDDIVVTIHNDDVHTYQQVERVVISICKVDKVKARQLTTEVDKLGGLAVFRSAQPSCGARRGTQRRA